MEFLFLGVFLIFIGYALYREFKKKNETGNNNSEKKPIFSKNNVNKNEFKAFESNEQECIYYFDRVKKHIDNNNINGLINDLRAYINLCKKLGYYDEIIFIVKHTSTILKKSNEDFSIYYDYALEMLKKDYSYYESIDYRKCSIGIVANTLCYFQGGKIRDYGKINIKAYKMAELVSQTIATENIEYCNNIDLSVSQNEKEWMIIEQGLGLCGRAGLIFGQLIEDKISVNNENFRKLIYDDDPQYIAFSLTEKVEKVNDENWDMVNKVFNSFALFLTEMIKRMYQKSDYKAVLYSRECHKAIFLLGVYFFENFEKCLLL